MTIEAEKLLRQVVEIPSISGEESKVTHYLLEAIQPYATETFIDKAGNIVAEFKKSTNTKQVIFLGHIDTVAGNIPVEIKDNKLYGRGSVDAKGSFCTALVAAIRFWQQRQDINITVIGAVEEEAPSSKGAHFVLENYSKPNALIIGEPSGWHNITLGYKGRLGVKLSLEKANFHSAAADTTVVEDMIAIWQDLQLWQAQINKDLTGIFNTAQMSLQNITSSNDGLTQNCVALIGFRLPPHHPPDKVEADLLARLSNTKVFVEITALREQPYRAEKDNFLTRAFRNAIRQQGGKPSFKLKTGTSDMNVVAPHWNIPTLAYGPGDSNLDHTPLEHLDLTEYEKAITVFEGALNLLATSLNK